MTKQRRKRHLAEQIVKKLRDAETMLGAGKTVAEVVQVLEISEQSYYCWKSKCGGMQAAEAKRLKELETENARLKKLLAEAAERPNAYAFLPEIKETLQAMLQATSGPQDQREQLARGLERFVLEDFSFSESELGGELLEFAEEFSANR